MAHATPAPAPGQVAGACRDFTDSPGLPFADHLPEAQVERALADCGVAFRHRLFSPAVTLWAFLSQALAPGPSCRAAVARSLAWRAARGLAPCSADTGAYCKARDRLPEAALSRLARECGRAPLGRAPAPWLWKGRAVKVADGTFLSMPDTSTAACRCGPTDGALRRQPLARAARPHYAGTNSRGGPPRKNCFTGSGSP